MATTNELVQGWLNSGGTASSPEQALNSPKDGLSPATEGHESEVMSENSTVDDLLPQDGEDTPADSSESQEPTEASKELEAKQKISSNKEVITVTDETGKRRKVEIDYSNRDAVKKAFTMAAGMRKFQAERDQAIKELSQKSNDWNTLESVYQKGPEELFDLLQGQRGAFKQHVQKEIERARFLENASPDEVKALETRERADLQAKELERIRKENEEFKKQVSEDREAAEMKAVESKISPVFDKYRFADKLGSADDEHMFDEMLWTSALKRLEPYEQQGLDLSPELIEREFRSVAQAIRKRIGLQAEKKATRVIEQKKREATENVQAKVMSGYKTGGVAKEAGDLISSGNLTGLLKGWSKYGSVFNKK